MNQKNSDYLKRLLEVAMEMAQKSKDPEIAKIIKEKANY